uniref:nucleoside kinase n=1 Tax=Alistipes sp. TaxID=1872444 RepID=UPI00405682DA
MKQKNTIRVICENDNSTHEVEMGTSLSEIAATLPAVEHRPWLGAYVNNRLKELSYRVYRPISIRLIDITSFAGVRLYQRTTWFVLQKAIHDLWPERQLKICHSLGQSGFYCEIEGMPDLSETAIERIEKQMRQIVEADYPIERRRLLTSEVRKIYAERGFEDKIELLDTRPRLYSTLYSMADTVGYFYGSLAPSSGYVPHFKLQRYFNGFHISLPSRNNPESVPVNHMQEKMFDIFHDYKRWNQILKVATIGQINQHTLGGNISEMIRMAEAVYEKGISRIADRIADRRRNNNTRLILISGPSSSGKTTTAKRLAIHLQVLGYTPHTISLDDYFVDRELTPRDEKGDYDFEALEAIDLKLFNSDLKRLLAGEEVIIPRYNFLTGCREWHEEPLRLDDRSMLIIEGIHGLNPKLTPEIDEDQKFKIYVSCFTSISMDNLTRIATSDNRLLRRMTRDYRQRGNNAQATLARWASVRSGEERHIFPYQENADAMFNSSLFYELAVLRSLAEPILREVPDTVPEYNEAQRLLQFLDNFTPIYDHKDIPPTSVLREFIGGSTFEY